MIHKERIAEYEKQDIVLFIVWILRNIGIDAEAQPLIGQDYSDMGYNYKPSWAVVVPKKDVEYADQAIEILSEFNWTGKESDKKILPVYIKEVERRLGKI